MVSQISRECKSYMSTTRGCDCPFRKFYEEKKCSHMLHMRSMEYKNPNTPSPSVIPKPKWDIKKSYTSTSLNELKTYNTTEEYCFCSDFKKNKKCEHIDSIMELVNSSSTILVKP